MARGIEVVRQDRTTLLRCRDCKRPYASKDIRDKVVLVELVNKPFMLSVQSRVPIHFSEVERESTIVLGLQGSFQLAGRHTMGNKDLTWVTTKSGSPARSSMLNTRNCVLMLSSLFTTVRTEGFFCADVSMGWPEPINYPSHLKQSDR